MTKLMTEKAMLAALNVSGWNARRRDKKASAVVHKHFNADDKSGNYNKCLIDVDAPSFEAVTKARSALRDYHYTQTLPWIHKGAQLLPAAQYLDYIEGARKLIDAYLKACDEFREDYPALKAQAKLKRNGLYNEEDYPTPGEMKRKFGAEIVFLPVPSASDFRVDIADAEIGRIREQITATVEQAYAEAMNDLWSRLFEPVKAMAGALNDPTRRFHDTLVSNVKEICDVLPKLNVSNDEKLAALCADVKKGLSKLSADKLRNDPDARSISAIKAADLAKRIAQFAPTGSL